MLGISATSRQLLFLRPPHTAWRDKKQWRKLRKSLATVRDIPLDVPVADSGERCPHLPQLHTYF